MLTTLMLAPGCSALLDPFERYTFTRDAAADGGGDAGVVVAWQEQLLAPDGMTTDLFGSSVALSGDGMLALVGAWSDDTAAGADAGSAHVFLRSGTSWTHEATLLAPDGAATDRFGASVAISGDGTRAVIGAPVDATTGGDDAGSAHVFVRSGASWTHEATLLAPDGMESDWFGDSVALSADGTVAVISAPVDDTASGADAGSAHVFVRSGTSWTHEAQLLAPDALAGDFFGDSVALSADGGVALISAVRDDTAGGADAGSAHVFVRSGTSWSHEAPLLAPDGMASDYFGNVVALSADGNVALIGAVRDDTAGGADAGSAHVFVRSGTSWSHETTMLTPDAMADDEFGFSVALSADGSVALVGAFQVETSGGTRAGSAHVFVRPGASRQATLLAPSGTVDDQFGYAVALSGDGGLALVGAYEDDTTGGVDAGSAYVFAISR